jgi:hypothetical protein
LPAPDFSGHGFAKEGNRRMTRIERKPAVFGAVPLFVFLALLSAAKGTSQTQEQSPSDLIRFLTYPSDRPDKHGTHRGSWIVFSCGPANGEDRDNRAVTNSLVKLGASAIPAIEAALDSIENRSNQS